MKRRLFLSGALAACVARAGETPSPSRERAELLRAAQASLARCDAAGALAQFERAASMMHAADAELGIVRSHMQAGDYRRALAFAAHTAAAHGDEPAGAALYAQLLRAGGQDAVAQQVIARASRDLPTVRFAPYATAMPHAQLVATAALMPGGTIALAPAASVHTSSHYWLRNGMGMTVHARVGSRIESLGLVQLIAATPLPSVSPSVAARPPFPGSAGFAASYAVQRDGSPAWPVMQSGFVAAQALGIELPPGGGGAPVFDGMGRLTGVAVKQAGAMTLVPMPQLRKHVPGLESAPVQGPARSTDVELVYEVALRHSLQVLRG